METIQNLSGPVRYPHQRLIAELGLNIQENTKPKRTAGPSTKGANKLQTTPETGTKFQAIYEGARNSALTSLAGTLRRKGVEEEIIRDFLLTQNRAACIPPLPDEEVERIAISVGQYEPNLEICEANTFTDADNATRFEINWKDRVRYVPESKTWLLWDGSHWARDTSDFVMELAKETARRIYEEGAGLQDEKFRINFAKHSAKSLQAERLRAMVKLAASIPSLVVHAANLDDNPQLLGVKNGVIDLETGELRSARQEDLMTKQAPVEFDPKAKCRQFEAFIKQIMKGDEELISYLRRVMGYCLTGLTDEQCLFFFYGSGANGKSTFLNVIKDVLGDDYCKQTPAETLMAKKNGRNASNDIARLAGARAVLSNEIEEGSRLSESLVKEMTGGDQIAARFLFHEYFEFRPQFKIIIAGNHQPVIRGNDMGIWRRLHLVPFAVTIPVRKRNPKLSQNLRKEIPGILNWALRGLREWKNGGLKPPTAVIKAVTEYRSDMDILGQWIEESCIQGSNYEIGAAFAYSDYQEWARKGGFQIMSRNGLGRRLKERFTGRHTNSGKVYSGFTLKSWAAHL